ncbi:ABC transporter ATP-binding protein [Parasphingorhabdus litoris]|uniref:ABC transporter ATP-binding protein n=2 Tax=Parasphingorhabdus litoris TaxID=394733 RepID=A0ABN1ALE4_9SPHN
MQDVQQGEIRIDGVPLAKAGKNPPPEQRPIGLVFQEGALFPHLTIAQNVGFGLGDTGVHAKAIAGWLEQVGLGGFEDRYPHMLSGGQRQRVALARAMAPEPDILLMDEPFANIDVVLRKELRRDSLSLLRQRAATAILVTHDPHEAMEMGDRIAVMENGRIVQYGSPDEFYDAPATAAIGSLVGGGQIVSGTRKGDDIKTAFGLWPVSCLKNDAGSAHAQLELLVQPTALEINSDGNRCTVLDVRRTTHGRKLVLVNDAGDRLEAEIPISSVPNRGDRVDVTVKSGQLLAFSSTS